MPKPSKRPTIITLHITTQTTVAPSPFARSRSHLHQQPSPSTAILSVALCQNSQDIRLQISRRISLPGGPGGVWRQPDRRASRRQPQSSIDSLALAPRAIGPSAVPLVAALSCLTPPRYVSMRAHVRARGRMHARACRQQTRDGRMGLTGRAGSDHSNKSTSVRRVCASVCRVHACVRACPCALHAYCHACRCTAPSE